MFKPVPATLNAPLLEEQMLNFWSLRRILARCGERGQGSAEFVFYEQPLSAAEQPGPVHALGRAYQDVFLRYRLMRGYHVTRRGGWSAPVLPPVASAAAIADAGRDPASGRGALQGGLPLRQWAWFNDRIAFWTDMQEAYVTYTNAYIESLWWVFKTLWDRGLLARRFGVVPYCPSCGTPLSEYEAGLAQRQVVEEAAYLRLPLVDEPGVSLLAWTPSPWTLPASVAVSAHPDAEYVKVERPLREGGRERLILARQCLEQVFGPGYVRVLESFKGRKLKGRRYRPLFTFYQPEKRQRAVYSVVLFGAADLTQGSGLTLLAPPFDAQALHVAGDHNLPLLEVMDDNGVYLSHLRPWGGRFVKDAEPYLIRDLDARGLLYRTEQVTRTARFCPHCNSPLLDYARDAWYLRTCQHRQRLAFLSRQVAWRPASSPSAAGSASSDRFDRLLEQGEDWLLGRERRPGAPLPVWECESCRRQVVVGSLAELSRLAGRDLSGLELRLPPAVARAPAGSPPLLGPRPAPAVIDQLVLPCPDCEGVMRRVPAVFDEWFEAGAAPVAQWHFPFENRDLFRAHFPADLVCQAGEPALGWFYALHVLSALLFDSPAFKNAVCLDAQQLAAGLVGGPLQAGSRGSEATLHRLFNTRGADALRWELYAAAPHVEAGSATPAQALALEPHEEPPEPLSRPDVERFTPALWGVYAFFVAFANRDRWQPLPASAAQDQPQPPLLDRWLRSELHALVRLVTEALDRYDVGGAAHALQAFVDDLEQVYLPRTRRRFYAGGARGPRPYQVLYETLLTLSKLLAPFAPFLAEAMYQNLARSFDDGAPESVHLCDWPSYDPALIDEALNEEMRLVRRLAALGAAARRQASIPESQPLAEAVFALGEAAGQRALERHASLLAEALSVRQMRSLEAPEAQALLAGAEPTWAAFRQGADLVLLKTGLTPELAREGLAGAFVLRVLELRRQAGCEIAEGVQLYATGTPFLLEAIQALQDWVVEETLALQLQYSAPPPDALVAEDWFQAQWVKVGLVRVESGSA